MSGASRTTPPRPPRLTARLVRAVMRSADAPAVTADLDERFEAMVERRGAAAARRWYRRQAFGFALRVPAARAVARLRALHGRRRPAAFNALARDLGYAARTLRKRPGFTVPALAVLALAIAANATVLSIVDNVLLRDLPFTDPESLVALWDLRPPGFPVQGNMPVPYVHYREWQERDDLFETVMAMETQESVIVGDEYAERRPGMMVSGNGFLTLGASAAIGRTLLPTDDTPDAAPVAVISDRLWRSRFDADPSIVGKAVTVDNAPVTIVGVMPAGFWFFDPYMFARSMGERDTAQPDIWRPLSTRDWTEEGWFEYPAFRVIARLRPGVAAAEARATLQGLRAAAPGTGDLAGVGVDVVPLADEVVGGVRSRLWLLQAAVALLVLIGCVNVTSLVLAKASATRGELAIRAALGAGRASLVRLALCEAALLGLGGGALGLLLARSMAGVVLRIAPRDLPLADRVAVDGRVVVVTLVMALVAGILAGLLPALGLDFRSLTRSMRCGARSVAGGRASKGVRFVLIATEVALTLVLLIGATVMVRSFTTVWRSDPGFDRRAVLTFFAPLAGTSEGRPFSGYHHELLDRVRALPGVASVGGTTHMPFSAWRNRLAVQIGDVVDPDQAPDVDARWITEGYLETMGIELRAGRALVAADGASSEPLMLVNEAFARRFFDAEQGRLESLVGRVVGVWDYRTDEWVPRRIIGIVENVKTTRLFEEDRPLLYVPERQDPRPFMRYVLRADADPMALVPTIRRLAAELDAHQPITEIYPLETLVAQSVTEERFYAQLLAAFGALAFVIAAAGIYGTVAYDARLRLREMGIRIAFGARPAAIRRLIVGQGLLPVAVGIVIGCAGAVALVRGLAGLVHGISPLDAPSFVAGALALAAVATLAALIPARRAATVDPIEVLRPD